MGTHNYGKVRVAQAIGSFYLRILLAFFGMHCTSDGAVLEKKRRKRLSDFWTDFPGVPFRPAPSEDFRTPLLSGAIGRLLSITAAILGPFSLRILVLHAHERWVVPRVFERRKAPLGPSEPLTASGLWLRSWLGRRRTESTPFRRAAARKISVPMRSPGASSRVAPRTPTSGLGSGFDGFRNCHESSRRGLYLHRLRAGNAGIELHNSGLFGTFFDAGVLGWGAGSIDSLPAQSL
jgi:hypothetical protein